MEYEENDSKATTDVLEMFSTTLESLEIKTRKANFEVYLRGLNKKYILILGMKESLRQKLS